MFDVFNSRQSISCNGADRRDFLKVGALGMTGLALPDLLRAQVAHGAAGGKSPEKTVIWLFLSGGPSHFETFDPKPDNPAPYRSVVGTLKTNVAGTHIGGLFPNLAKLADKYSIIRSFAHTAADHTAATHWLSTGVDHPPAANGAAPISPSIGSMLSKCRGPNHPSGMPTYIGLDHLYAEGPAWLGTAHTPFDAKGNAQANMVPRVALERMQDRRTLRESLDRIDRQLDQQGMMSTLDEFESRAIELVRGSVRDAFDLSKEDAKLRDRYGKGEKKLGENLLLARRLAEANAGLVTVWYGGWDSHGTNPAVNHGTIEQEMHKLAPEFDHAVSVFIEDLYDRGLQDKVLLAIVGEFGRSPHINKDGGREHWPQLGNQVLVGGGMKMGQIIGESTTKGDVPHSPPISPNDLLATLFQYLNMPLDLTYTTPAGRPTLMLDGGRPIAGLL